MTPDTDEAVMRAVAPTTNECWRDLFNLDLTGDTSRSETAFLEAAYALDLVVPFDWPAWSATPRFPNGHGLASAPVADAVRLITAHVRADRFAEGTLRRGLHDGSLTTAIQRLWTWYSDLRTDDNGYVNWSSYSDDQTYRWFYERRWAPGPSLCWVGLNPGTGDTDGKRRPTLAKVVGWAKRADCSSVTVVNLFSYRATDPKALRHAPVNIIGDHTDDTIRLASKTAKLTLAAWGDNKLARAGRSQAVYPLLDSPLCIGTSRNGEPLHPLYQPAISPLIPYNRCDT